MGSNPILGTNYFSLIFHKDDSEIRFGNGILDPIMDAMAMTKTLWNGKHKNNSRIVKRGFLSTPPTNAAVTAHTQNIGSTSIMTDNP